MFLSVTSGVLVRPGKSTIDHSGTMQSDTTPGLTQGVPGAPDVGHETAFFLIEKHDSSLGDEPASTNKVTKNNRRSAILGGTRQVEQYSD